MTRSACHATRCCRPDLSVASLWQRDTRDKASGVAPILDAVMRATRAEPAVFALIVDAKDENSRSFYVHLGFRPLISRPASLYWPWRRRYGA